MTKFYLSGIIKKQGGKNVYAKRKMEEKFCDVVKKNRLKKGLSINELAIKSGLSSVQIRNIENGSSKPHISNLKALSEALECDYEQLFELLRKDKQ